MVHACAVQHYRRSRYKDRCAKGMPAYMGHLMGTRHVGFDRGTVPFVTFCGQAE